RRSIRSCTQTCADFCHCVPVFVISNDAFNSESYLSSAEFCGASFVFDSNNCSIDLHLRSIEWTKNDPVRLKPSRSFNCLCSAGGHSSLRRHFIYRPKTPRFHRGPGAKERSRIGPCHRHRAAAYLRECPPASHHTGPPT